MPPAESDHGKPPRLPRLVLRAALSTLLLAWLLLDTLLSPLFGPLFAALARLRVFAAIGSALGRLPPYAALLVLGIPFAIVEPIKVFALYWMSIGHLSSGAILLVVAYLCSVLVVDRIYHAAHAPLMRIVWFRRLMAWLAGLRELGLGWARATVAWRAAERLAKSLRASLAR